MGLGLVKRVTLSKDFFPTLRCSFGLFSHCVTACGENEGKESPLRMVATPTAPADAVDSLDELRKTQFQAAPVVMIDSLNCHLRRMIVSTIGVNDSTT